MSHRNINSSFIFLPVLDANDDEWLVYGLANEKTGSKSTSPQSIGQNPKTIGRIANATANKLI